LLATESEYATFKVPDGKDWSVHDVGANEVDSFTIDMHQADVGQYVAATRNDPSVPMTNA